MSADKLANSKLRELKKIGTGGIRTGAHSLVSSNELSNCATRVYSGRLVNLSQFAVCQFVRAHLTNIIELEIAVTPCNTPLCNTSLFNLNELGQTGKQQTERVKKSKYVKMLQTAY